MIRYDPLYEKTEVICPLQTYTSHGMFVDYASSVVMMRDHTDLIIPMSFETAGYCFPEDNVLKASFFNNTASFVSYKFDAGEVCFGGTFADVPSAPGIPLNAGIGAAVPLFPGFSGQTTAVTSAFSSIVLGAGGAGVVGFFAVFAVVVGVNNTKKEPPEPLSALMQETGSSVAAFENPTFTPMAGPSHNVLA